jgi:hypothetical protein
MSMSGFHGEVFDWIKDFDGKCDVDCFLATGESEYLILVVSTY